MLYTIRTIFLLALVTLHLTTLPATASDMEYKRQLFIQAEKALLADNQPLYAQHLKALGDYPLTSYLVQQDLQKRMDPAIAPEMQAFLQKHQGQPVAESLRKPWLKLLGQKSHWQQLLQDYQPQKDLELQCFYGQALLTTGKTQEARNLMETLWLTGTSLPDACDPLLASWKNAGGLTQEKAWQRAILAMEKKQMGLAKYLRSYLANKDQHWLDLWLGIADKPETLLTHNWKATDPDEHDRMAIILNYGMNALIRKNPALATAQWDALCHQHGFTNQQYPTIANNLALYLCLRFEPQAIGRVLVIPEHLRQDNVREWAVRTALRHENWDSVQTMLEHLTPTQQQDRRWIYWQGRVEQELGRPVQAQEIYATLNATQDYYGLLAAAHLQQPKEITHAALDISQDLVDNIVQIPGLQRAAELFALHRWPLARSEWQQVQKELSGDDLLAAALWAQRLGWHDRAIVATIASGYQQDLSLLYPIPHLDLVTTYGTARNLEPALLFSLMRQESLFMSDIGSAAGALGLMQIMPQTGKQIAGWHKETLSSPWLLLEPDRNIRYGTSYLRRQLDNLQNHMALALAAYNAGPGRPKSWLPSTPMPADIWVETIPFNETRLYVEKVLGNMPIYASRLDSNAKEQLLQLPPVYPAN